MISYSMLVNVLKSVFSASAGIPSGPADFPFFNVRIAFLILFFVGLALFTCSISYVGGISAAFIAGLFSNCSK